MEQAAHRPEFGMAFRVCRHDLVQQGFQFGALGTDVAVMRLQYVVHQQVQRPSGEVRGGGRGTALQPVQFLGHECGRHVPVPAGFGERHIAVAAEVDAVAGKHAGGLEAVGHDLTDGAG